MEALDGYQVTGFRMSVLLSVQGLTKAYGQRPLFKELSFDLAAGERVGLIGPNGAGKSTLLKLLAGREPADAGIRSSRRTTRIGFLAQDDFFEPGSTVREVMLLALAGMPMEDYERETQAAIYLTKVGFEDHDQFAHLLSGGWRKRLGLARELMLKPDLLLLDEPTNHLDLPGILWLERLLRSSTFGYLVATHDRAFLRAVADDILEINRVISAPWGRTRILLPAAMISWLARRASRRRWPTRCGAKPSGWVARRPRRRARRPPVWMTPTSVVRSFRS